MKSFGLWVFTIVVVIMAASAWLYYCWESGVKSARLRAILATSPVHVIRIEPTLNDRSSLVTNEVVITDPKTMADIVTAVRTAPEYFPNHPVTRWDCHLEISSAAGNDFFWVNNTMGQGTILYYDHRLTTSTLRSDTLGAILEKATRAP